MDDAVTKGRCEASLLLQKGLSHSVSQIGDKLASTFLARSFYLCWMYEWRFQSHRPFGVERVCVLLLVDLGWGIFLVFILSLSKVRTAH